MAIALGTLYFEALNKWQHPRLPIVHPERVVSMRDWDMSAMRTEGKALPDFAVWRDQVGNEVVRGHG